MNSEAAQNGDFDTQFKNLFDEIHQIEDKIVEINKNKSSLETSSNTHEEMKTIMEGPKWNITI